MLVTLMLLAVLTVGAVSAADNLTDATEVLHDASSDEIGLNGDGAVSSAQEDILSEKDNGTFTDLQKKIDDADEGSTIILENDYAYDEGFSNYTGIAISKSLIIDGNNHTIDGKSIGGKLNSRIFLLKSNIIVLKNINFKDCLWFDGGAIYNEGGDNCSISSCDFINCSAIWSGAAIYNAGGANFNVSSCDFINCSAGDRAVIYNYGDNCSVGSCDFINCSAEYGGAIYNFGRDNCSVGSCEFINCSANYIGAIYNNGGANCSISSCEFIDCSANYGGAIDNSGDGCSVCSCIFINYSADELGGCAIGNSGDGCSVCSCIFINCSSVELGGGAIYNNGEGCSVSFCNFADCFADGSGGAICNYGDGCSLSFSNFTNCFVDDSGGAIYNLYGNNCSVSSCIFINCSAFSGGAIHNSGEGCSVRSCDFIDCSGGANAIVNSQGGIDFHTGANFSVSFCNFIDSSSSLGWSIFNYQTINCSVSYCNFTDLFDREIEGYLKVIKCNFKDKFVENETAKYTSVIFADSTLTTVYNGGKYLVVDLQDIEDFPITGANITIKLSNGKTVTQNTGKKSRVKMSTDGLEPKTYTATITFAGNDFYKKAVKSVKITVKKATPKMTANAMTFKKSVKTKKYTVTLKTNQNKVMKNTQITLKVNGKTYSAKTDSKGVATFKITKLTKKGKYTATVTYKGNSYYNKLTKNVKITVK